MLKSKLSRNEKTELKLGENLTAYHNIFTAANHQLKNWEALNNKRISRLKTATVGLCSATALSAAAFFGIGIAKYEQKPGEPELSPFSKAIQTSRGSRTLCGLYTFGMLTATLSIAAPVLRKGLKNQNKEITSYPWARTAFDRDGSFPDFLTTFEAFTGPSAPPSFSKAYEKARKQVIAKMIENTRV